MTRFKFRDKYSVLMRCPNESLHEIEVFAETIHEAHRLAEDLHPNWRIVRIVEVWQGGEDG